MKNDILRQGYLESFESPHKHWSYIGTIAKEGRLDDLLYTITDYYTQLMQLMDFSDFGPHSISKIISGQIRSKSAYEIYNLPHGVTITTSSIPNEYNTDAIFNFYSKLIPNFHVTFWVSKFKNSEYTSIVTFYPVPKTDSNMHFKELSGHAYIRCTDEHFINMGIHSSNFSSDELVILTDAYAKNDFSKVPKELSDLLKKETSFNTDTGLNEFLCNELKKHGYYDRST